MLGYHEPGLALRLASNYQFTTHLSKAKILMCNDRRGKDRGLSWVSSVSRHALVFIACVGRGDITTDRNQGGADHALRRSLICRR